ncbi:MAG: isoprenyl transferase [Gammaproteobacteria bacterium]
MSTTDANIEDLPMGCLPRHIAIIMDGNGRWAQSRNLPRVSGHRAGVEAVRGVVRACGELGIEVLTLFAFSSENWRRPQKEVGLLMDLFVTALQSEIKKLHKNDVRFRLIGDRSAFKPKLQKLIADAEALTADNRGLTLVIAANYGGRWDVAEAAKQLARQVEQGELAAEDITPEHVHHAISMHDLPEPDLFIRTGGEQRISNFLIWQLAYSELYFTETLWPDFNKAVLQDALNSFACRQRRFGLTGEQVEKVKNA